MSIISAQSPVDRGAYWFQSFGANAAPPMGAPIAPDLTVGLGLDMLEVAIIDSNYPKLGDLELVELVRSAAPDQWGNELFATVRYDGVHVTSWAGHRDPGAEAGMAVWVWQCYAD